MNSKNIICGLLVLFVFCFYLIPVTGATETNTQYEMPANVFRSVDTMKESRDASQSMNDFQIQHTCNLIASMNVTHITVDSQYDYPDYMRRWVKAVRRAGKKVWFRSCFSEWEDKSNIDQDGYIERSKVLMTPEQNTAAIVKFIKENPDLFESGDIFDATPEAENGTYWRSFKGGWVNNNTAKDEFNAFMLASSNESQQAFKDIGVEGVITGIRSTNGWIASQPTVLYQDTVEELGYVSMDFYPGNDISLSSDASLQEFKREFMPVYNVRNVPIVIAEFGYSIKGRVTNEKQLEVLQKWFDFIQTIPNLHGINYWVGPGRKTDSDDSIDKIFEGTTGSWKLRPAGEALKKMFKNIETGNRVLKDPALLPPTTTLSETTRATTVPDVDDTTKTDMPTTEYSGDDITESTNEEPTSTSIPISESSISSSETEGTGTNPETTTSINTPTLNKKNNMGWLKLLILGIGVLVLAVGGWALWFFKLSKKNKDGV